MTNTDILAVDGKIDGQERKFLLYPAHIVSFSWRPGAKQLTITTVNGDRIEVLHERFTEGCEAMWTELAAHDQYTDANETQNHPAP